MAVLVGELALTAFAFLLHVGLLLAVFCEMIVLIGDVGFVKRSRRYRNTNYWRRDFCIKHLDQNERLDDFGSRTRPQIFFF